jgi:hypothetical protein
MDNPNDKDWPDDLPGLIKRGIPVFAEDPEKFAHDIIRSMYYAVAAQFPNYNVIFPHEGTFSNLTWIVEDTNNLEDSIALRVETTYIYNKGSRYNEWCAAITVREASPYVISLPREIVQYNWDYLKKLLPKEEFAKLGEGFDIHIWYDDIAFAMRYPGH